MDIVLIGTDTPHRRFLINKLSRMGHKIVACIFETTQKLPSFETKASWEIKGQFELLQSLSADGCDTLPDETFVVYVDNLNSSAAFLKLQNLTYDICIVSGARQLSGHMLQTVAVNGVNVHMGIATAYRGLDTNLWAIYHRDYSNVGVTLHRLDATLDTGDLYEVGYISKIHLKHLHMLRLYETEVAIDLLSHHLTKFKLNKTEVVKQQKQGRYYSFMPAVIKDTLSVLDAAR